MALAGLLALIVGVVVFRQLDDRPGLSLRREVVEAVRLGAGDPFDAPRPHAGFFLVVEGGDGSGKSTLASGISDWLQTELGHQVVLSREPGGTAVGVQIRALVLDWDDDTQGPGPVPRAEALLFAADRAQHVATVIQPALAAGAVVIGDRYIDSSVAYQGTRGDLVRSEVARLSQWATDGLRPDLTVLLDVDPAMARNRLDSRDGPGGADRLESAGERFHDDVRQAFLDLAGLDGRRYLIVDASLSRDEILARVVRRLRRMVPLSEHQRAVMAQRLAVEAQQRHDTEAAAVAAAQQEDDARRTRDDQLRQREDEARAHAEQLRLEEAERFAAEREQERASLRDSDTAVVPVVGQPSNFDAPADPAPTAPLQLPEDPPEHGR